MAIISPPGTFAGPCEGPCDDLCCEHDRWLAGQLCLLCWEPLGFERPFDTNVMLDEDGAPRVLLAHQECTDRLRKLVATGQVML